MNTEEENSQLWKIDYTRCHHHLIEYLKKRCAIHGLHFASTQSSDDFVISQSNIELNFVKDKKPKTFVINEIIEISNEHLLGLQNPAVLFDVYACMLDIYKNVELDIIIIKNEIKLLHQNFVNNVTHFSINLLNELDKIYETQFFTIQLASDDLLVLNRCLKISSQLFFLFFEKRNLKKLFCLVSHYQECFLIAPVCCRMQSLAFDASFQPIQNMNVIFVKKYRYIYLKIAKLLYPFFESNIKFIFNKKYFEIIPSFFISHRKPMEILEILERLKLYNIDINILRKDNVIRLGKIFDCSLSDLFLIFDAFLLENVLFKLQKTNVTFYKVGDFLDGNIFYEPKNFLYKGRSGTVENNIKNISYFPECSICTANLDIGELAILHGYPIAIKLKDFKKHAKFWKRIIYSFDQVFSKNANILYEAISFIFDIFKLSAKRNYRRYDDISGENDLILINERFWCEKNEIQNISSLVKALENLENEEGLCLWYDGKAITHLYKSTLDDDYNSLYFSQKLLDCFYDFEKEFFLLQEGDLFHISYNGEIEFDENYKILPSTFQLVTNKKMLVDAIMSIDNLTEFLISIGTLPNENDITTKYNMDHKLFWDSRIELRKTFIKIAKLLNPFLNVVPDKFFINQHFNCLPFKVFYGDKASVEKILEYLENLKLDNIQFLISGDKLCLKECCDFTLDCISDFQNIILVKQLYEELSNIETINDTYFSFEENYIENEDNEDNENNANSLNFEQLNECLEIIESQDYVKVRILQNGHSLSVDAGTYFSPHDLLAVKDKSLTAFFKALLFRQKIYQTIYITHDHWKNWNSESLDFKKVGGYSFIDNDENVYLNIIKMLQPNLKFIERDQFASFKSIELIPQNLIMEKPDEFLQQLQTFEAYNSYFQLSPSGELVTENIELTRIQFMAITEYDKFFDVNNKLKKLSEIFRNKVDEFTVKSNGYFSMIDNEEYMEGWNNVEAMPHSQLFFVFIINAFEHVITKSQMQISLTLNTDGALMVGKFIWAYPQSFIETLPNSLRILKTFDLLYIQSFITYKSKKYVKF